MARKPSPTEQFARLIGVYADQTDDDGPSTEEFIIPEDLSELTDEELANLHEQAVANFDAVFGEGSDLSDEDVQTLQGLTQGIEGLAAEVSTRSQAAAERAEQAAALRDQVHAVAAEEEPAEEEPVDEPEIEAVEEEEQVEESVEEPELVTASSTPRREVRVPMSRLRGRQVPASSGAPKGMKDLVRAAGEGTGFAPGTGLDWLGLGKVVDKRLQGYNHSQYANAAARGVSMRQQFQVATIEKPIDPRLQIRNSDPQHVQEVLDYARSEARLPGSSLVASGGWCAPSEVIYDLLEVESRDGLFSVPTVGFVRGGISRTLGPDFADIFAADIGFHYTEAEDIAGDYDGDGGGSKPCYSIECPEFEEFRLEVDGLCIQAGLLMQRGYPEVISRTIRGVLVAHDHKMSARRINAIVDGSDAVLFTDTYGTIAPLLSAIELQAEHTRYIRRLSRGTTLEAVFPYWVRGVVRADLSRRTGVELFSVTDAQINGWFSSRGINPQFVYNWQDLAGDAGDVTAWPTEVEFLMYPSGTWIEGTSDVITLDTLYDSTLLGTNDYTALFTEEGAVVVKMGFDSRVVTVPICPDGTTAAGVTYECGDGDGGI